MIKHKLLTFLSVVAVAFFTTACFDESGLEIIYDGPSVLEWDRASTGSAGSYLAGAGQTPTESIAVNLVGPHRDQATQVQWRVNQEESTAIEGVHYNILSDQNITIPANSSTATVDIEVITDNFASPEERFTLVLELVGGDLPVAANYGTLQHSMTIRCPSEIPAGEWEANVGGYVIEIIALGEGNYSIPNMNLDFQPSYYGTFTTLPIGGGFTDVCNEVTFNVEGEHGVIWSGTGTYDAEAQTITVPSFSDPAYGQGPWDNNGEGYVFTKL